METKKIKLIKEAVEEWASGKMTAEKAMYAVHAVVNTTTELPEAFIRWAHEAIKEDNTD